MVSRPLNHQIKMKALLFSHFGAKNKAHLSNVSKGHRKKQFKCSNLNGNKCVGLSIKLVDDQRYHDLEFGQTLIGNTLDLKGPNGSCGR